VSYIGNGRREIADEVPTIVCLCGSTRFTLDFAKTNMAETLAGRIVLAPGVFGHDDYPPGATSAVASELVKGDLDTLHFRKIDLADEILVVNPGGYVGSSTRREIEYAEATGKPVRWLEPGQAVA
jgi:hypothetical protein